MSLAARGDCDEIPGRPLPFLPVAATAHRAKCLEFHFALSFRKSGIDKNGSSLLAWKLAA
jgi:hypothetical protein